MTENAIAREVVDAAFRVHGRLGPGLLESVYESVLAHELNRRGLQTTSQQPIPVVYEGVQLDTGFRADLIVNDKVIIEIKSIESLAPVHKKQLLTYPPSSRQTTRPTHQLQRQSNQGRNHKNRQRTRRRQIIKLCVLSAFARNKSVTTL
jgi:GxxExxY protein